MEETVADDQMDTEEQVINGLDAAQVRKALENFTEEELRILLGYLGIKDTRAETWEIAIELDEKHTHQGYGPQSIVLFLNGIHRITGRSEFRAVVEVDNLPSQKCFEKIGAELIGLCNGVILKTDDEKKHFEDKNLDLINEDMARVTLKFIRATAYLAVLRFQACKARATAMTP